MSAHEQVDARHLKSSFRRMAGTFHKGFGKSRGGLGGRRKGRWSGPKRCVGSRGCWNCFTSCGCVCLGACCNMSEVLDLDECVVFCGCKGFGVCVCGVVSVGDGVCLSEGVCFCGAVCLAHGVCFAE